MRRQARISAGGVLIGRSASSVQVWLWLLIFIFQNEFRISRSIQPGYLDFDNLPETNFTCTGKVIGGYYADLETSCQMFHVCTVGQQDEPMDIKFLCLNGTVFDQETRVCERVDEVDCTKSEKFYSLNLELYGNTSPSIIQADQSKPQAQPTEQSVQHVKPSREELDPTVDEAPTTTFQNRPQDHSTDPIDSTEDPIQDTKRDEPKNTRVTARPEIVFSDNDEIIDEYQDEEIDDENQEYEDYARGPTTTMTPATTTTPASTTTSTTTTRKPNPTTALPSSTSPHLILSQTVPPVSSSSLSSSSVPSANHPTSSIDPALLSPQEFIYHHRGPGSEAISFQRQSFRPADGVYITHAPPQQFDHFQYESSRTAPRPAQLRPSSFVQRPQPAPFRPTTLDPRDQLLRPGPTSQSSERHETSIKHRPLNYQSVLPAQRPLPFNPYYYDRKRSDDAGSPSESSLSARSVAPSTVTERPPIKLKSPPRVIVTASASVSDSNGKRLNYTVGNVVSAVKPIVPINYDDYKESDLIFDPFFLDVPKLQKRRKTRSNKHRKVFTVPATSSIIHSEKSTFMSSPATIEKSQFTTTTTPITTTSPLTTTSPKATTAQTTTTTRISTTTPTTTTAAWNPDDYVDDNYEPQAYIPPEPPLAVLLAYDQNNYKKQERPYRNDLAKDKSPRDLKSTISHIEESRPTSSAAQTTSSQIEGAYAALPAVSPPPPPAHAPLTAGPVPDT